MRRRHWRHRRRMLVMVTAFCAEMLVILSLVVAINNWAQ
jgi:hypothetical protein